MLNTDQTPELSNSEYPLANFVFRHGPHDAHHKLTLLAQTAPLWIGAIKNHPNFPINFETYQTNEILEILQELQTDLGAWRDYQGEDLED